MVLRRHCVMGSLSLALLLAFAASAIAQTDTLPAGVINSPSLAGAQQEIITKYVKHWVDKLTQGKDSEVVEARGKLIDPLKKGGSAVFNSTYDKEVATQLSAGIDSDRVLVKINTMIVAKELMDDRVDELVKKALQDKSPPVRYLAGKAAQKLLSAKDVQVLPRRKEVIVAELVAALKGDVSPWVFGEFSRPLIAHDQTKSYLIVLEALDKRVAQHVGRPTSSISVELSLLNELSNQVVQAIAKDANAIDVSVLKELCRVTWKYAQVSIGHRGAGVPDKDIESLYSQITDLSSKMLLYITPKVDPDAPLPAKWARAQLPIQQLALTDYKDVLKRPKFGYEDKDLQLKSAGP